MAPRASVQAESSTKTALRTARHARLLASIVSVEQETVRALLALATSTKAEEFVAV